MEHSQRRPAGGTVVAVVGDAAADALAALEGVPGIEALTLHDTDPALASRRIAAAPTPWVVHDADPLVHVAAAWVELFEERATLGTIELEVEAALSAFRSGDAIMPDYYIVLDPDSADATWRHWWCGALGHQAPRRVLPVESSTQPAGDALRHLLRALPTSRPWPEPASWLPGLPFDIPDRVGLYDLT
ncbi:hypothetical protein [Microbacterium invictum]|uniref:Uncharacterized protein n=1 Tax=Microbacterium invictum TaxID=515415 RepID=A0AA40SSS2_9MICO|nr:MULTISPECIES: hypothetical protein [Microbacterium]MBB4141492.1 hypothetical protein [Microbacterium invictum]